MAAPAPRSSAPRSIAIVKTSYTRSASEAFDAVDDELLTAATAQGHSAWQRFWRVELPLAGESILAGTRVVSASTISLVSVGALIGVQSLGTLFTEGYSRSFLTEIAVGIVGTVILAVVFDVVLQGIAALLMPWTRRQAGPRRTRRSAAPGTARADDAVPTPDPAVATAGGTR